MAIYLTLKNQVASDLHRSDLSSQIVQAISDAIQYYERESWWFLEGRKTMTTVAGQAWYAVPSDLLNFDNLLITISGNKVPLNRIHYTTMDNYDSGSYQGQPYEWTFYDNQIRFYPVPDTAYTITLSDSDQLDALSSNSDSNSWTTDGYSLIRHRAVWDIYMNHLKSPDMASLAKSSELEAHKSLRQLHDLKTSTGKIKKTDW